MRAEDTNRTILRGRRDQDVRQLDAAMIFRLNVCELAQLSTDNDLNGQTGVMRSAVGAHSSS